MYKILIVDDEQMIREGIEMTMPWSSLGIGEVYTAASAIQAAAMIEEKQPDLMITDIQMAEMTGLELVEDIREKMQSMRIIILTGYDLFEYAHRALQLQVHDFLLKPVDEEELEKSIRRQIQALEKERDSLEMTRTRGVRQQDRLEHFLRNCIRGKYLPQEAGEFYRRFHFTEKQRMCVGIVSRENRGEKDSDIEEYYCQTIRQICMGLIDDCGKGLTFTDEDKKVMIVFFSGNTDGTERNPKESAGQLLEILENECADKTKVFLGSEVQGFEQLMSSYDDAVDLGKHGKKPMSDLLTSQAEHSRNDMFRDIFDEFKQRMVRNFSNLDEVMHILNRFCMAVDSYDLGQKQAAGCYFELASAVYFAYINETGNMPQENLNSFMQSLCGTDRKRAHEVTEMFLQKILANEEGDEHELIRKTKNMIYTGLGQDITVASLAAGLYVTPNYLSRLFKKITGEGCNEYIIRKRIEKAKSLLETTNLKAGEIATLVGYHDMNYFSLAFKKHTGQSPTKYRSSLQK